MTAGVPHWASAVLLSTWNVHFYIGMSMWKMQPSVEITCTEQACLRLAYTKSNQLRAAVELTRISTQPYGLGDTVTNSSMMRCLCFANTANVRLWSQVEHFLVKLGQDIRLHKFCLASSWIMNLVLWKNSIAALASDTLSRSHLQVQISGSSARDIWTLPIPKAKILLSILFWIWKHYYG